LCNLTDDRIMLIRESPIDIIRLPILTREALLADRDRSEFNGSVSFESLRAGGRAVKSRRRHLLCGRIRDSNIISNALPSHLTRPSVCLEDFHTYWCLMKVKPLPCADRRGGLGARSAAPPFSHGAGNKLSLSDIPNEHHSRKVPCMEARGGSPSCRYLNWAPMGGYVKSFELLVVPTNPFFFELLSLTGRRLLGLVGGRLGFRITAFRFLE